MTLKEAQKQNKFGDVMTLAEFRNNVKSGCFIPDDGIGYLHDGEKQTGISVWSIDIFNSKYDSYPYVCWYNK